MIIQSKKKDYYDYLTNIYGKDNNLILNRDNTDLDTELLFKEYKKGIDSEITDRYDTLFSIHGDLAKVISAGNICGSRFSNYKNQVCTYRLIFLGRCIPIIDEYILKSNCGNGLEDETSALELMTESSITNNVLKSYTGHFIYKTDKHDTDEKLISRIREAQNKKHKFLYDLCLKMKRPYFVIKNHPNSTNHIHISWISFKYPILSEIKGFINLIPAEECYKEITNFLVDLKANEDLNPPVNLSDKDKIHKAGFDTKKSFRNMK